MSNINRDYLIVLNPKTSKVTVPELNYYIYDKYTANLFVNLVTVENGKVVNLPDADQYKLVLHVLKPTNEIQDVENIQVFNKEKALFQIELDAELTKNIGRYKCELLTIDQTDHIVQSAKFSYRVKKSIYNDLDVVTETPQYPIIITLLDKLQDIDKYEEERRANEVARVAAEKARVKDYTDLRQTVTTDIDTMQQKINSFDGKVQEVDNAVTQMRTNITDYQTEKNTELDNYKTQKDTQINTAIKGMETTIDKYKTEKDTQINDKITQQDNKIDSAINLQNKNIQASTKALNDKLDKAVQDQNDTIAANNQTQNKVINDAITEQNKTINTVVENDKAQDGKLDALGQYSATCMKDIKKLQDKDVAHEERMTAIEAVNVEQNNRLDAIEIKNDQQDGRLNDVEAKNKKQDLDLKCLFAESHSERITLDDEVGNSVFLQNSKQGFATVDELKGNTLVNCNKDTDKELILNGNIDTSGYTSVTTTEGIDGGKVDVALEGNTMVNVCDQEDPVAITKSYIVETGNHVALQGEYDGKCRPNIYGNTLVNLYENKQKVFFANYIYSNNERIDLDRFVEGREYTAIVLNSAINFGSFRICTGDTKYDLVPNTQATIKKFTYTPPTDSSINRNDIRCYCYPNANKFSEGDENKIKILILEGDYTNKPIPDYFTGMQSSFEDKLITDENDANNGKYKVDYKVTGKNKFNFNSYNILNNKNNNISVDVATQSIITQRTDPSSYEEIEFNVNLLANKEYILNYTCETLVDNNAPLRRLKLTYEDGTYKVFNHNVTFSQNIKESKRVIKISLTMQEINSNKIKMSNIQLEEGTTATTYEPYKEYTKTLYLNSPLLEGDTIEQSGNDIVHMHRYNKVVFDGSDDENWVYWGNNTDNGKLDSSLISFYLPFTNYKDFTTSTIFNNKFLMGNTVWGATTEIMALNADNIMSFQVALLRSKLATQDVAGFKTWLQANPITVAYELATPTREVISTNDNLLLDSYVNGHLDVNTVVPIDKAVFQSNFNESLRYLYPNTEYTIQFESDNIGKIDKIHLGGINSSAVNVVKGINKYTLTTDELSSKSIVINGIGFNMSKIVVTPKVEQPFGYFKGMKSVGECEGNVVEVVAQNKNLFDKNKLQVGNGSLYGYMYLGKGANYTLSVTDKDTSVDMSEIYFGFTYRGIDATYNFKWFMEHGLTYDKTSLTQSLPYFSFYPNNNAAFEKITSRFDIQIEEGTKVTTYTAPKQNKQTLTHEPLRGLPNGVKDKYVIIDGKWYIERNCGYGIFNGSDDENWLADNQNGDNGDNSDCVGFKIEVPNIIKCANGYGIAEIGAGTITSNNLRVDNLFGKKVDGINYGWGRFIFVKCSKSMEISDFKLALSLKPLMVVYKLAQPTYEPIDYNPFEVYTDITHISNNSNIPCNMVIRNSGFNCILKPNTTYTVSSNNGLSSVVTKNSIGDGILRFYDKDTTSITKMSNVLVLEGDYVTGNPPIPAFFKGMESAFEQQLVTDEKDEHYGKYKVNVKATNPDNSQQNNITFYIKEPLRGVGDIKDKVYVKEDKVVVERNCGSVTLDGSEDEEWSKYSINNDQYHTTNRTSVFYMKIDNKKIGWNTSVCNNFTNTGDNHPFSMDKCAHGMYTDHINYNTLYFDYGYDNTITLGQFRKWLQNNPTTVVYELAQPTYEEVEYFDLKLFVEIFKDTTIIYNSNIPVTSTINYTYATPLTDAVNTVSDISDEQDSMIIDMATQVATMEMMLM